jgi:DNA (cytosine-5)-methyltransferase 1
MIRFLDLCCGIGGFHEGVVSSCRNAGIDAQCCDAFDTKPTAKLFQKLNFGIEAKDDITKFDFKVLKHQIDLLCCGFPCQPFSNVGKKRGLRDERNIFEHVMKVIQETEPHFYILENVEGLLWHGSTKSKTQIGPTMQHILSLLTSLTNYTHKHYILDASYLNVPQKRKRILFFGVNKNKIPQHNEIISMLEEKYQTLKKKDTKCPFSKIQQQGVHIIKRFGENRFLDAVLKHFGNNLNQLSGKTIRDYRGGPDNIATWDFNLKGSTTSEEKSLLTKLIQFRRQKQTAKMMHVKWKDGIPVSEQLIHHHCSPFTNFDETQTHLLKLSNQGYLKQFLLKNEKNEEMTCYDIVKGQLLYPIYKIVDPNLPLPTLTTLDAKKLWVIDGNKLRPLTQLEIIRSFGFPDSFLETFTKMSLSENKFFDLLGNSLPPSMCSFIVDVIISNCLL